MGQLERLRSRPPFEDLQREYHRLQRMLNARYPEASEKTPAEREVYRILQQSTNLSFYQSVWIANRNVDLFCPAIGVLHQPVLKGQKIARKNAMRGLVVEVDGPIHDSELKMRKDTSKYKMLQDLGIGHYPVVNSSLQDSGVRNLIRRLKETTRLDSRARRRLLRKIYIATLAYHASDEVMVGLYGPQFTGLMVAK